MGAFAWAMGGCLLAAFGVWAALVYARRRQLVDVPDARRNHSVPTPRGGGVGITFALLVVAAVSASTGARSGAEAITYAGGLLLVAGVGWIDDHRPLSAVIRLVAHVVAGVLLAIVPAMQGEWLVAALAVVLVPAAVNVWNFMDGINGIATLQAALCLLLVALLLPDARALPVWAALGACVGFLPFNFPRARIFLGDVGSGTLGFALAGAMLPDAAEAGAAGWLILLPAAPFFVDAGFTLAKRMIRGERWWTPHSQHLYQRLVRAGRSHAQVALGYAAFSLTSVILSLFVVALGATPSISAGVISGWFLIVIAVWFSIRDGTDAEESARLE